MNKIQELRSEILKLRFINFLCFLIFLLPTLGLIIYCLKTGASFSHFADKLQIPRSYKGFSVFQIILASSAEAICFALVSILAFAYYKGFKLLSQFKSLDSSEEKMLIKNIFIGAIILGLIMIFTVPFDSSDIFGYINRGVQQAFYNLNPYLTTVSQIPSRHSDLMFHSHWIYNPAPYGFLFIYLTKLVCLICGKHFFATLISFKILNFLAYIVCCLLIMKMGRKLNLQRPWFALYLFAWNPLVLLDALGNGHNDLIMGCLLMLSAVLLYSERWLILSLPVLALSVLIKYTSILAFPFFCYYFFANKKWKTFFASILISAGVCFSLTRLYLTDLIQNYHRFQDIAHNATLTLNSLHSALFKIIVYLSQLIPYFSLDEDLLNKTLKLLLWSFFVIFFGLINIKFWQKLPFNNKKQMFIKVINYSLISMTVMIVFASSKFYGWYVCMFFPLIFLLEEDYFIRRFVIILSVFQLLSLTIITDMNILDFILPTLIPLIVAVKFNSFEAFKKSINDSKHNVKNFMHRA